MSRLALTVVIVLLALPSAARADGVLILEAGGGLLASGSGGEPATVEPVVGVAGTFDRRVGLAGGGYLGTGISSALDLVGWTPEDRSFLSLILGGAAPGGPRWRAEAGCSLSAADLLVAPEWSLQVRGSQGSQDSAALWARYEGAAVFDGDDEEDHLLQVLRLGVTADPSIRFGWRVDAGALGRLWWQWPLYTPAGVQGDEWRRDVDLAARVSLNGLAGYFGEWSLDTAVTRRFSDANRWPGDLEERSEDRWTAGLGAGVGWSPTAAVGIELGASVEGALYPYRAALDAAGAPTGAELRTLSLSADLRADWSPDGRRYLFLSALLRQTVSNEPGEREVEAGVRAGLDLRL